MSDDAREYIEDAAICFFRCIERDEASDSDVYQSTLARLRAALAEPAQAPNQENTMSASTKGYKIAGEPVSDAVGEEFGRLLAERDRLQQQVVRANMLAEQAGEDYAVAACRESGGPDEPVSFLWERDPEAPEPYAADASQVIVAGSSPGAGWRLVGPLVLAVRPPSGPAPDHERAATRFALAFLAGCLSSYRRDMDPSTWGSIVRDQIEGAMDEYEAKLTDRAPSGRAAARAPTDVEIETMYDAVVSFNFPTSPHGPAFQGQPDREEIREGLSKVFALRAGTSGEVRRG